MVAKTYEQEGYLIYKSNIDLTGRAAAMAPVLIFEGDRPLTAQMDSIFRSGELPAERLMLLDGPLEIFYTPRERPQLALPRYAFCLLDAGVAP
ncbi:MAG: hypothetical protein LH609_09930 [Rudanella sp.]|nr:hypothetical protein [Rudanella sp.]